MILATPSRGPILALTSAALFGASTPFAKTLVGEVHPALLAAILYLGSGLGLLLVRSAQRLFQADQAPRSENLGRVAPSGWGLPSCSAGSWGQSF